MPLFARRPGHPRSRVFVIAAVLAATVAAATPATALNDPLYERQWGLAVTGARAAWDRGIVGAGVEVAVVDTGAHLTHQDLVKNIRPGRNFIDPSKPPQDDWCDGDTCGHGTHVAGIAVASIDDGGSVGVAPKAGLVPVKGFGSSGGADAAVLAAGITWAADQGAEVINMSFGPELPITGTGADIVTAIRYAWSKGSICVVAAGNSFLFTSDITDEPAIVVSATTKQDVIADFSNGVGDAKWGIAAPGGGDTIQFSENENIWSTVWTPSNSNDTYAEMRGTSQAAPFVSGAVALLRSAGLSPQQTVDRLLATAKDLGAKGPDTTYGAGRLDIAKATEGLSPASSTVTGAPAPTTASPATTTPRGTTAPTTAGRPSAPRPPATTVSPTTAPVGVAGGAQASSTTTAQILTLDSIPPGDDAELGDPASKEPASDDEGVPIALSLAGAAVALAVAGWAAAVAVARRRSEPL